MLSVVIPVFNEAESLAILHQELSEVAAANGTTWTWCSSMTVRRMARGR